jgi:AraC-like DNA-binding protein
MTKPKPGTGKNEPAPNANSGELPARRRTENLPDGLYYFEDALEIGGVLEASVITCAGWLLELLELEAGDVSFAVDGAEICPSFTALAIFYPPFTITRPCFRNTTARLKGLAGTVALPAEFLNDPIVFETDFAGSPQTVTDVVGILRNGRHAETIAAHPKPSLLSLKAKRLIDENYRIFPSIARIAARLAVSHEHLTRQFRKDFALSPSAYLHQLRIADATFRLAQGEPIIDVSGEVGYHDLSRFYKQFRKSTAASPGFCQTLKK